jgi:adhesin transport system membrane fusion protein
MSTLSTLGQGLIHGLEAIRTRIAPLTDRLLDRLTGARVTAEASQAAGMRS